MTIGDINAKSCFFSLGNDNHRYVVTDMDWDRFKDRYTGYFEADSGKWCRGEMIDKDLKQCEAVDFDQSGDFYAVYVEDCFDPPMCIVRADDPSDAQERFLDEKDWADIDKEDAEKLTDKDWDSGLYTHTGRNTLAHTESVMVREIKLVRIDLT